MNIAIFSPNQNPYSETFIQAHKDYLKGNIFYYYGAKNRIRLEGKHALVSSTRNNMLRLKKLLLKKPASWIPESKIIDSLKTNSIDVILIEYGTHAHHLLPVLKQLQIPFVVHFHGYDASVEAVVKSTNYYKEVFLLADKIIVVSQVMKSRILDLGCPPEKLVYNVYGPKPEFHDVQPNFSKKQFIAIGRFTDKKAPYYTILAFKKVLKQHSDAELVIAGNGPLWNSCQNLVRHYDIEDKVKLVGVISPEQYRNYLQESLAFVQHSITATNGDMEGTPLAVLEASASGLPIISTVHAGIPDVIIHEVSGLLSEEHDVELMAAHMLKLLDDVAYAQKLGKNGSQNIAQNFSLQRHIGALQDILKEVV